MSLQRAAAGVAIARGLGLCSALAFTLYTAHRFGSDRGTDIAFMALIIPNALMAVISILLPPVLTSVFKSIEAARGADEAWAFARTVPRLTVVVFAAASAAGALASPWLARWVGGGLQPDIERYMRLAFLLVFFTGISSVLKGILNANGALFVPSLDTVAANATGIAIAAVAADSWGAPALVAAAVGGGAAKVILMVPQYLSKRRPGPAGLWHPSMGQAGVMLVPVLLNGLLFAILVGVLRALASRIPVEGAVSHLTYAERIYSAPADLFVASLGVALLPALSGHAAAGEMERVRHLTTVGLRMSAFFGIPAAVGLGMLAEPVVALLFQHGRFDGADTAGTAAALRGYAPSLAFSGHMLLYQAFYAIGRTKAIVASGATMLVGTVIAGALLVGPYGQGGLALGFSISYMAGWAVSLALFARAVGWPDLKGMVSGILRTAFCSAGMAGVLWAMSSAHVLARIAAGSAVFLGMARFLCPEEWAQARKLGSRSGR